MRGPLDRLAPARGGIAEQLAREGYALAINGVRAEAEVAESLSRLRAHGVEVVYAPGDVASEAGREALLQRTLASFGPPNLLVNNAGVAPNERRDVLEMTRESYERVLGTNLAGLVETMDRRLGELDRRVDHRLESAERTATAIHQQLGKIGMVSPGEAAFVVRGLNR